MRNENARTIKWKGIPERKENRVLFGGEKEKQERLTLRRAVYRANLPAGERTGKC